MIQREIWYADLNPVKGSEQQGLRPVVIISGNVVNKYLKVVIVCPLTTKIKNFKGNIVLQPNAENGLSQTSEILTFHVRSVSKERLVKKIGKINVAELNELKDGLNDILTY
ncbi:MAG TPA: type II toxin-antitoxin system PemK/MazF family toxin [Tangfeifania sp.]|nr:type II toxin-antitoxin system PemK/MazF family toxin [Tangfeifania sp.]